MAMQFDGNGLRLATLLEELDRHGVSRDAFAAKADELRSLEVTDAPLVLARSTLWHLGAGARTDRALEAAMEQLLQGTPRNSL